MISNRSTLDDVFNLAVEVRTEIQDVHRERLKDLKRIFGAIAQDDKAFTLIKDMIYYRGGYPHENSPPKITQLVEHFVKTVAWLHFLGYDHLIDREFEKYGMKITYTGVIPFDDTSLHVLDDKMKFVFLKTFGFEAPATVKELLQYVFMEAEQVQGHICRLADKIKFEYASMVKDSCGLEKNAFKDGVFLGYKGKGVGEIDLDLGRMKKIHEDYLFIHNFVRELHEV